MNKSMVVLVLVSWVVIKGQSDSLGPIRLFNKDSTDLKLQEGIVQVLLQDDSWVTICSDGNDMKKQANVICHQLGFKEAMSYSTAGNENYGTVSSSSTISMLECESSNLLVIHQCNYLVANSSCSNSMDLTVNCSTARLDDDPYDTMVRLVDGPDVREGRVEIYCNGNWGTVCFNNTNEISVFADLVCQQLGYTTAGSWANKFDGSAGQNIWMKDVNCPSSFYECVSACEKCPGVNDTIVSCDHTSDLAVLCVIDKGVIDTMYTNETCKYTGSDTTDVPIGAVVGVVLGGIVVVLTCIILLIIIPVCICCCLKVRSNRLTITGPTNYANFE